MHPGDGGGSDPKHRAAKRDAAARKLMAFAPLIPLVVLLAIWLSGGLKGFDSAQKIAHALDSLHDSPYGFAYTMLAFGIGTLLFIPITAVIAGTLWAFGPLHGLLYAFIGVQLAAASTYWCGRALGSRALDYASGERMRRFRQLLQQHAIRASAAARVLPIGNFTLLNWLIGGMRVPFRWFLLGNALGALPGLCMFAFFADRLAAVWDDPEPRQIAQLLGASVAALALGYLVHRLAKHALR